MSDELPTCDKHRVDGGRYAFKCAVCEGLSLEYALSRVDYALGKPKEMHVSNYDVDYDADRVVARALAVRKGLEDAIECVESWSAYAPDYFKTKHGLADDLQRLRKVLDGAA